VWHFHRAFQVAFSLEDIKVVNDLKALTTKNPRACFKKGLPFSSEIAKRPFVYHRRKAGFNCCNSAFDVSMSASWRTIESQRVTFHRPLFRGHGNVKTKPPKIKNPAIQQLAESGVKNMVSSFLGF